MAFRSVADDLRDQAPRLTRRFWDTVPPFAEEVKLIFGSLESSSSGPATVDTPGFDPLELPPFDFQFPPLDLQLPQWPLPEPNVNINNFGDTTIIIDGDGDGDGDTDTQTSTTTETSYYWERVTFPGEVLGQSSGSFYNIRVHPNGNLSSSVGGGSTPYVFTTEARLTDPGAAGTVSPNTWVWVFWVAEYRIIKTVWRVNGAITNQATNINVQQQDWVFIAPSEGGGGKVARITETISARSGTTPGQGQATLYEFSTDSGELSPVTDEDGEEISVVVYNMVSSELKGPDDDETLTNRFIQVKKIDNVWFVDVEDCSTASGEADIETD